MQVEQLHQLLTMHLAVVAEQALLVLPLQGLPVGLVAQAELFGAQLMVAEAAEVPCIPTQTLLTLAGLAVVVGDSGLVLPLKLEQLILAVVVVALMVALLVLVPLVVPV